MVLFPPCSVWPGVRKREIRDLEVDKWYSQLAVRLGYSPPGSQRALSLPPLAVFFF